MTAISQGFQRQSTRKRIQSTSSILLRHGQSLDAQFTALAPQVTGKVLFTIPLLTTLQNVTTPFAAFLLIAAAWMIVSGYTSINAVVKAELFPTTVRALGVGLPYALTVSIFGGTVDSVALSFKSIGHEQWFYYYLTCMIGISLVVYLFMRDTKADSAMHRHV